MQLFSTASAGEGVDIDRGRFFARAIRLDSHKTQVGPGSTELGCFALISWPVQQAATTLSVSRDDAVREEVF